MHVKANSIVIRKRIKFLAYLQPEFLTNSIVFQKNQISRLPTNGVKKRIVLFSKKINFLAYIQVELKVNSIVFKMMKLRYE